MPLSAGMLPAWIGAPVRSFDGATLGRVADVFFDARTHRPEWLLVASGGRAVFAPYGGCVQEPAGVTLAVGAAQLADAPASSAPPFELAAAHAAALALHYRVRSGRGPWTQLASPRLAASRPAALI